MFSMPMFNFNWEIFLNVTLIHDFQIITMLPYPRLPFSGCEWTQTTKKLQLIKYELFEFRIDSESNKSVYQSLTI